MIYSSNQIITATFSSVDATHPLLAEYGSIAQKHDIVFSPTLLLELQSFLKRNRILGMAGVIPEEDVCPDCLKAHLLAQVTNHCLSPHQQRLLKRMLPGRYGHQGHYLDGEEVRPILPRIKAKQ